MLQSFLFLVFLHQGTFTTTYTGYTYGIQGDVVILDPLTGKPYETPKKPVWISWTEDMDSSRANVLVYHEGRCDTMEFIRFPKRNGWFLEKLNGKSRLESRFVIGHAHKYQDSIDIGIGSFAGIAYYAKKDSMQKSTGQ
jgi:hypothetical protein